MPLKSIPRRLGWPKVCLALTAAASISWTVRASGASPAPMVQAAVSARELLAHPEALAARVRLGNPVIGAASARVDQSRAQIGISGLRPNPVLTFSVGGMAVGTRNPEWLPWPNTPNVTLGISQTLEIAKRGARMQASRLGAASESASLAAVEAEQIALSREQLARITWLAARAKLLADRLANARNVVELERVRLERGEISGVDHDRLVLDAAAAERDVSDNAVVQATAHSDCAVLLGAKCEDDASMDDAEQWARVPEVPAERLIAERPDLRALRLAAQAAEQEAVVWERRKIPDPTIGLSYTRDYLTYAGNQPNTLMLWAAVPVPTFDRGQHQAAQARARAAELRAELTAAERRAVEDVRELQARTQVLDSKLSTLTSVALPRAEAALRGGEEAYRRGQISLTDLLLLRRELPALLLAEQDTRFELMMIRNKLRLVLGLDAPGRAGATP